jgi:(p)ppGpp synthase/HD superfamily hydrolase
MTDKSFSPHFSEALSFAAELHRHQLRKGVEVPYISHLLAVAAIAIESGADEDEAIAALLHDAIEDAPDALGPQKAAAARNLIEMRFGRRVLDIVEACTDSDTDPKPPWVGRKEKYIATIAHKPASAVLVGLSDKIHNARAILRDFRATGDAIWSRFNKDAGKTGTLGYYRGLVDAYRARAAELSDGRLAAMIDELERAVDGLETEAGQKGVWPIGASRSA